VREPGLGWARRIQLYNNYVEGNAELLSISSEDSGTLESEDENNFGPEDKDETNMEECEPEPSSYRQGDFPATAALPVPHAHRVATTATTDGTTGAPNHFPYDAMDDDAAAGHSKYKQSLLHRYLTDSCTLQVVSSRAANNNNDPADRRRNPSGSLSSHDFEDLSTSSRSSPTHEWDDQTAALDHWWDQVSPSSESDMEWKEVTAALALTTMARSRARPFPRSRP